MIKYNYTPLKSIREKKGLTQEQMANDLGMSQSNYSKLENNHKKIISIELLNRLCKALNYTAEQLEALLTNKEVTESLQDKITIRETFIKGFIDSAIYSFESKYKEGIPWEEFCEYDIEYVVNVCGIKTKEEYEKIGYPLVSMVSAENNQIAFEEMLDDMNIYSCFEFGLVNDKHYLEMWEVFKKRKEPKFIFKPENGGLFTARVGYGITL